MNTKIKRGLRIRYAPLLDQPHSLKLELSCKLPPLHDTPPVPSKHLTRCLRNRVQASLLIFCCARYRTSLSRLLSTKLLVALGEASYSIYLTHIIMFSVIGVSAATVLE